MQLQEELRMLRGLAQGDQAAQETMRLKAEMERIKRQHQEEMSVLMKVRGSGGEAGSPWWA